MIKDNTQILLKNQLQKSDKQLGHGTGSHNKP